MLYYVVLSKVTKLRDNHVVITPYDVVKLEYDGNVYKKDNLVYESITENIFKNENDIVNFVIEKEIMNKLLINYTFEEAKDIILSDLDNNSLLFKKTEKEIYALYIDKITSQMDKYKFNLPLVLSYDPVNISDYLEVEDIVYSTPSQDINRYYYYKKN